MNRLNRSVALSALLLMGGLPLFAQKEPISHETLWLMKRVGAPAVSPDGKWVVFLLTSPSYEEKEQSADLWIVPADRSAEPRRLTSTKATENDVAWSNDSRRLAFGTKREGDEENQIYVIDIAGGEATRVTSLTTGARMPVWSPDNNAIAFMSGVFFGAADEEANKKTASERKSQKFKVRVYDTFPIRRWDKWLDDAQSHVFVQRLDAGAKAKDLLAGTLLVSGAGFGGRGSEGSGDTLDLAWTPDGKSIVFTATSNRNTSAFAFTNTHLYEVAVAGGEPKQLTSGNDSFSRPKFSSDGKKLYYLISSDWGKVYALDRLGMTAWASGALRFITITKDFDRSIGSWDLSGDGRTIYLTAEHAGTERIFSMPADGGEVKELVAPPTGVYTSLTVADRSRTPVLIASWGSSIQPAEIVSIDPVSRTHKLLTSFNVASAAKIDWSAPRHFWFTSSRGKKIHNMIVLPSGFDPARKYPLFVLIHGGAANMWRDQISLRWNYHLLVKPGYVLLLTNYTGSTGFGEKFAQEIGGDPLAGPATEINEAADEAIKQFSFIDGSRQAAGGASYGGHLTNWLLATTTRYKCLISHAGLMNLEAQWGTSDGIYHREIVAGGPVWEQGKVWREQNPIRRAASFKTPILFSIGENDFRVPLNNTLEAWSAVQRMQVPSRLLVWPDENHWILKGENSRVFYREVHNWLSKWL
ncbi:MAG TPA: S9 family peptidase [Thermoanaerobaculia bacterium]|nr:S9 family peptidase [Thermoanaerobaculia bacterium]